ncbi:amino acid transporter [Phreatobacter aquaticus]|uniref:Amino acid transporter n=1 Tax=Phreatobacter aquaticus TaxID=2570229 RepID=A0A4D7QE35_9HYPH|nr:LysE/ArgO family amino acid transporter [Phreatobacter aquaticus]QCK85458.1 amino acid transporter [Phreatobacter aquaticus]
MNLSMMQAGATGFLVGLGLIVAIGAQNAFVLRQGLLRQHVGLVTTICALSDAALILVGVAGLGTIVQASPLLLALATWGGALFLAAYGFMAARRAFSTGGLEASGNGALTDARHAVAATLAFTFLNPHVYLDTVVLVGSLSAHHQGSARAAFAIGAMSASAAWFYGLGYGARWLAPLFARPVAWRILDALIAIVMLTIAANLALSGWRA